MSWGPLTSFPFLVLKKRRSTNAVCTSVREILAPFRTNTSWWNLPLFNEEFKSFHISDGIFIHIYSLWSDEETCLVLFFTFFQMTLAGCGQARKKEVTVGGETPGICPERKCRHARNPASGKPPKDPVPAHPCCSEETAPLFTEVLSFVPINSSNTYSWEKEKSNNTMSNLISDSWGGNEGGNHSQAWLCLKIQTQVLLRGGVRMRNQGWKHCISRSHGYHPLPCVCVYYAKSAFIISKTILVHFRWYGKYSSRKI